MYPQRLSLFGTEIAIWDLVLATGVVVAYAVLRVALAWREPGRGAVPCLLPLRSALVVYVALLGAQTFSYAFDAGTTMRPPVGVGWVRYYLDPTFGPKTLYGCVLALPLAAYLASEPWRDLRFSVALDAWTPAMFTVLGCARLGCLLQGCCYGARSGVFGVVFPEGAVVYHEQMRRELLAEGAAYSLPVVPTQAIEALACFALVALTLRALARGETRVFAASVVAYSVVRFAVELIRDDPARNSYGPLSTSQWVAIIVLAAALVAKIRVGLESPRTT